MSTADAPARGGAAASGRRVLRRGVQAAARAADAVRPPAHGVVVLAYHQVGGPRPGSVNLAPAAFADQMAHLAQRHRVIDLDAAVALVDGAHRPPVDPVVITFDDGTADFVDAALPVLVDHDLPVTLYLATGHVEAGRSFWDDGTVLSWAAVADALTTGLVTVASHTDSHRLLDRCTPAEAADDLDRSVGLIEDRLGVPARHLAYPKAVAPSLEVAPVVAARFRSGAAAGGRPNPYGSTDLHRLSRTPIVVDDDGDAFARKAAGGLALEGRVRELVDRRRYRSAER